MTKEELLKMNKKEIEEYLKLRENKKNSGCSYCSDCSGCSNCSNCSYCSGCSDCSGCYDCSYCSNCSDGKNLKYAILNIELTKEEYFKKIKELKNEK